MISMDLLAVGVGVFSFGIFLFLQVLAFRWVQPERLLKALFACVIAVALVPLVLMVVLCNFKCVNAPWQSWLAGAIFASLIEVLICAVYVLCFFGPYETSVRMRLLREIGQKGPQGISQQDLFTRYNTQVIVNLRLQRLIGSGDIIEKDGVYRIISRKNLFFIFDTISGILKKWINQ